MVLVDTSPGSIMLRWEDGLVIEAFYGFKYKQCVRVQGKYTTSQLCSEGSVVVSYKNRGIIIDGNFAMILRKQIENKIITNDYYGIKMPEALWEDVRQTAFDIMSRLLP